MQGSYVPPILDTSSAVGSVAVSVANSKLQDAGLKTQSKEDLRKEEERSKIVTWISTGVATVASKFQYSSFESLVNSHSFYYSLCSDYSCGSNVH